ncbi:MBL fold metallo-hydrolase [Flavobacterium sp. CBA20B-1]|uniref:MBL fold metallo-hydrolase n=1 Tax=unclassified Flavobacterium TaxID=196869 RepID=UPI0022259DB1|nr:MULTISPECIES: MBL fold metallo-hydrolase [unclassified Flavobacterium]WCM42620.1 MBL fold metallo-hydrolase [Flavobacterium sp. CBA20B-1]
MKVYFLGTGTSQGIPVIGNKHPVCLSNNAKDKRLRSSVLIEWNHTKIAIDCGPDFRQQMLRIDNDRLDALLFTHEHADHTAGLDDIRPYCFMESKSMPIYAQKRVIESLKNRFDYIFETENRYPGAPSVTIHEVEASKDFYVEGNKITPINVHHGSLPILGYRLDAFAYLTDVKTLDEHTYDQLKDLDVLVINALRIQEHPTHNNLEEALIHIQKINPKKAYLTHIGFQMGFHEEVQKTLPENVFLAYDQLILDI